MTAAPFTGVRIIAVEQFGPDPFATLNLAAMGAEVIKIEDPHPVFGTVRAVRTSPTVWNLQPNYRMTPPLGADNEEILHDLGYDDDQNGALCLRGALGGPANAP